MKIKNKSSILMFFLFCIVNLIVYGQELNSNILKMYGLTPINEKDVHWNVVQSEIERITKIDPNSLTGNRINYYGLINTKDANSLFPNWKFYLFTYSMYKINVADRASLAFGLKSTLAVSDSNPIKTFVIYNSIDYEKFLKLNKISIHDVNDAKLVWNSWCEIHRKGTKDLKVEKISDNEWRLGINSNEQTISSDNEFRTVAKITSFFKITTDPNTYQITKCKDEVQISDKRQESTKED